MIIKRNARVIKQKKSKYIQKNAKKIICKNVYVRK